MSKKQPYVSKPPILLIEVVPDDFDYTCKCNVESLLNVPWHDVVFQSTCMNPDCSTLFTTNNYKTLKHLNYCLDCNVSMIGAMIIRFDRTSIRKRFCGYVVGSSKSQIIDIENLDEVIPDKSDDVGAKDCGSRPSSDDSCNWRSDRDDSKCL